MNIGFEVINKWGSYKYEIHEQWVSIGEPISINHWVDDTI